MQWLGFSTILLRMWFAQGQSSHRRSASTSPAQPDSGVHRPEIYVAPTECIRADGPAVTDGTSCLLVRKLHPTLSERNLRSGKYGFDETEERGKEQH